MTTENEEYVTFTDSRGNVLSNDPRWHAKNRLKQSGVDVDSLEDENARLRRQLEELMAKRGIQASAEDEIDEDGDEPPTDENGLRTYEELDGKALNALLKERNITVEGKKTVGSAREALRKADADAKAAGE